ncbi:hypothetical protein HY311_02930 [Candidatus Nomurabacteria bacterium]|nr:hypothetical protein [Candidatus Nomurabacteria bacterium]
MSKPRILLVLGTWVTILPYLGFPNSWKDVLYTLTGLGLVFISYLMYRERKAKADQEKTFDNFSENSDFGVN